MNSLEARLYFTTPCFSTADIRHTLNLVRHLSNSPNLLLIVESQREVFDDFPGIFSILKDEYGKSEEKNSFKETRIEIQAIARREKIYAGLSSEEKAAYEKVRKVFKGRFV